jgi:hypothetical protein
MKIQIEYYVAVDSEENWTVNEDPDDAIENLSASSDVLVARYKVTMTLDVPEEAEVSIDASGVKPEAPAVTVATQLGRVVD